MSSPLYAPAAPHSHGILGTPVFPVPPNHTNSTNRQQHTSPFNLWLVIMTAIIFFAILAWYNFSLAVYRYMIGSTPESGISNGNDILSSFGFAFMWTVIVVISYLYAIGAGKLNVNPEEEFGDALQNVPDNG